MKGVAYEGRVGAVNAAGGGAWSESASATPSPEMLVAPVEIALAAGDTLGGYDVANLIDGSGLSAPAAIGNFAAVTTSARPADLWVSASSGSPNYFDGTSRPRPVFELGLGREHDLRALVVWGVGGDANEASEFEVEFSTDGGATYSGGAETVRTEALLGSGSARLGFNRPRRADHVRVTVTGNAAGSGHGGNGGDRVGMSELRLVAETAPAAVWSLDAPSGIYISGDTVEVTVRFSAAVEVSGVPVLELETGTVDRQASYASGSGAASLVFEYTVQPGDESADLDYTSQTALGLPAGAAVTTPAAGGIDAELALPAPGSEDSLAGTSAVVVDHGTVRAVSVGDAAADEGEAVAFTVSLSPPRVDQDVALAYTTIDGTAFAGSDYTAAVEAVLTIAAGQTSAEVSVATTQDSQQEPGETFTLVVFNPANVAVEGPLATATGTIVDDDPLPAPPPPVLTPADQQMEVSWTAPEALSPITAYDVRHRAGRSPWTTARAWTSEDPPRDLSHTIGSLVNGRSYRVQVRAVNAAGAGPWSSSAQAAPRGIPAAPPPPSLTPANHQLEVSWKAPADGGFAIIRYDLRHSRGDGSPWMTARAWTSEDSPRDLSHTIGSLVNGRSYRVQVRAVSAAGAGPWSSSAQ
ncbi:MAG: fibronectin type III domain-containing protein, partial [Acidobacteria bacterium]|nr:fibronectin type III domain-containing protein [Acidobacteriota bacterium]